MRRGTGVSARIAGGFVLLSLCACVSALHEPPSVGELAGTTTHGPADVDRLLDQIVVADFGRSEPRVRRDGHNH